MDDWFTVETIDSNTFVISEYKHWEETHCYLICGTERAFNDLSREGKLKQGNGVFEYGEFQIHI